MAIVFHCACGRALRAGAEASGKKTKCPGCGSMLTIPNAALKAEAPSPAGPPAEDDPFAPALDWSTVEAPKPRAEAEPGGNLIKIDEAQANQQVEADPPRAEDGSRQYRVLSHKEQGIVGKFTAGRLEEVLNAHAKKGWSLKAAVVIAMPGHGGNHDELVVILER